MNWKDILKYEPERKQTERRRQVLADIEMGLGDLIKEHLDAWVAKESDETTGHEASVFDIGDEPIILVQKGQIRLYVDAEDDYYLQVYMNDYSSQKELFSSFSGQMREQAYPTDEYIPIGTYNPESNEFVADERLLDKVSTKALRVMVPTLKRLGSDETNPGHSSIRNPRYKSAFKIFRRD